MFFMTPSCWKDFIDESFAEVVDEDAATAHHFVGIYGEIANERCDSKR